jgi:hypothetical protein
MADNHTTYENRSTEPARSTGTLAFVVGGLVVLVGILAYVIFGDDLGVSDGGSAPANIEINSNADSSAGAGATEGSAGATATDTEADAGASATTGDSGAAAGAEATTGN